jgi:hypothetical protein
LSCSTALLSIEGFTATADVPSRPRLKQQAISRVQLMDAAFHQAGTTDLSFVTREGFEMREQGRCIEISNRSVLLYVVCFLLSSFGLQLFGLKHLLQEG